MKAIIVLGFVAIATSAVSSKSMYNVHPEEWNLFKTKFNKVYEDVEEELFRKNIYLDNKITIEEHNKLYDEGQVTYKLGMNKFGDMNNEEINAQMNGFNHQLKKVNGDAVTFLRSSNESLPSSVDWRDKGYVTPIKDQFMCGACWAFSATGSLEGQHFRKTGNLVSLSEQNLVDCTRRFGNNGCEDGLTDNAFKYIKANKGIDTEESYPYKAKKKWCRYRSKNKGATTTGFVDIAKDDEDALQEAVATIGPIAIAIDASLTSFHFYEQGLYYDETCNSENPDHGALVVGYGTTESGDDYWIVKNSWGGNWGLKGYVLMARNRGNHCGIAAMGSYPLV